MALSDKQIADLTAPLDPKNIKARRQAGQNLSYVEAWHVIAEANRIFGHDGWSRETVEMREVRPAELVRVTPRGKDSYDQWRVGFMARVRVTIDGCSRDGTGFGSGYASDMGDAYEGALKEAESDATKRALVTFGWAFGLALYDKSRANVGAPDDDAPTRSAPAPRPPAPAAPPPESTPFDDGPPPYINDAPPVSDVAKTPSAKKPPTDVYATAKQKLAAATTLAAVNKLLDLVKERRAQDILTAKQFDELWTIGTARYTDIEQAAQSNVLDAG